MPTIYALLSPSGQAHYIGHTTAPRRRYYEHLRGDRTNAATAAWIESLQAQGQQPRFKTLEVVRASEAEAAVQRWSAELLGGEEQAQAGRRERGEALVEELSARWQVNVMAFRIPQAERQLKEVLAR